MLGDRTIAAGAPVDSDLEAQYVIGEFVYDLLNLGPVELGAPVDAYLTVDGRRLNYESVALSEVATNGSRAAVHPRLTAGRAAGPHPWIESRRAR